MFFLAWKNLVKEPTRFVLTLMGVTFAVVLLFFNLGAYLGFVEAFAVLVDHSNADVWITLENNVNFDAARPFPERKLWKVRQVKGIEWAEPVIKGWSSMKLGNGATETVMVVGSDPDGRIGWPWKLREGRVRDLRAERAIIVDESALAKLGGLAVGDRIEVFDTRMEVVGISEGVRTFTTYPIVFTRYETAKRLAVVYRARGNDEVTFIVAKLAAGASQQEVLARLRTISGVDVYTKEAFAWNTRKYWIVQTGVGLGFGVTALLGFFVGMIIVGQTIYASTLEHLREFGTLKALGATNGDLLLVIVYQAIVNASIGYGAGLILAVLAQRWYEQLGLILVNSTSLKLFMLGVTLVMCVTASVLPIRRAFQIDPATVFRG